MADKGFVKPHSISVQQEIIKTSSAGVTSAENVALNYFFLTSPTYEDSVMAGVAGVLPKTRNDVTNVPLTQVKELIRCRLIKRVRVSLSKTLNGDHDRYFSLLIRQGSDEDKLAGKTLKIAAVGDKAEATYYINKIVGKTTAKFTQN